MQRKLKYFWCELFGHSFEFQRYENYTERNGLAEASACFYKCTKCGKVVKTTGEMTSNTRRKGNLWL